MPAMQNKKSSPTTEDAEAQDSIARLHTVCDRLLFEVEELLDSKKPLVDLVYQMKALVVMLDCVKVLSAVYDKIYERMQDSAAPEVLVRFADSVEQFYC